MSKNQTSTETIREGLEKDVADIIQKHKRAMDKELKPYIDQLTKIAALDPCPKVIPTLFLDDLTEEEKAKILETCNV